MSNQQRLWAVTIQGNVGLIEADTEEEARHQGAMVFIGTAVRAKVATATDIDYVTQMGGYVPQAHRTDHNK